MRVISGHLSHILWVRSKSQDPPTLKGREPQEGMRTRRPPSRGPQEGLSTTVSDSVYGSFVLVVSCHVNSLQLTKKKVRTRLSLFLDFFFFLIPLDYENLTSRELTIVSMVKCPRSSRKEKRSCRNLRRRQQREKGEPREEVRHLIKTLRLTHSFIYSFIHSCPCSRGRHMW